MCKVALPNSDPIFFKKMGHFSATVEDLVLIIGMADFHNRFNILGMSDENLRPKCANTCLNFSESDSQEFIYD